MERTLHFLTQEGTIPIPKKKRTTSIPEPSTLEPSPPVLPEQQEFYQHLRTLAQSTVRIVVETLMREELDRFIGAAWGECSPKRKGYRNGHYTRDLVTSTGRLEDLKVPRDREGQFHTQAFERYRSSEPHIAEGLTQMFVAGTSTHKVGEVAQTLLGLAPSASTISRLNQNLTQQFEAWHQRPLHKHWRVLYLDGVHFKIRHGDQVDITIILTALGVDLEGNKEVLALRACAEEGKDGWLSLLHDLRSRGATHIDLIVTDGHDGCSLLSRNCFRPRPVSGVCYISNAMCSMRSLDENVATSRSNSLGFGTHRESRRR
jgi:putative transposase